MKNNIKNGFRACRLYLFNPNAVDYSKCVQNIPENMQQIQVEENVEITSEEVNSPKKVIAHLKPILLEKNFQF